MVLPGRAVECLTERRLRLDACLATGCGHPQSGARGQGHFSGGPCKVAGCRCRGFQGHRSRVDAGVVELVVRDVYDVGAHEAVTRIFKRVRPHLRKQRL